MSAITWLVENFVTRVEKNLSDIGVVFETKGPIPGIVYMAKRASVMLGYYFNLKVRKFDIPVISLLLNRERMKTLNVVAKHTKPIDKTIERVSNYACNKDLGSNSIVYSFGIHQDIGFESELINLKNCKVYAYDPTPSSKEYVLSEIKRLKLEDKLIFKQQALWTEDGTKKFFTLHDEEDCGSLTNLWGGDNFYEVECRQLETFLKENGHNSIDLLKMDIEGAAIKVLRKWIDTAAKLPNSMAIEIERPKDDDSWFEEIDQLLSDLQNLNFEIFFLTRRIPFRSGVDLFLRIKS